MKGSKTIRVASLLSTILLLINLSSAEGAANGFVSAIAEGWHPWYEIKADPELPQNLIVCGTKWDSVQNGPVGVVYASSDGGANWRLVLEDKSSEWVTEHSCAMGPNHTAYFVSEASKVVDDQPDHELGTTHLFVSRNAGMDWIKTMSTGWADYSTSAVSVGSRRLYTFFSSWLQTRAQRNIGLLVFSADGERVSGPFFDSRPAASFSQSVFASHAIALNSGAVVALYYGRTLTPSGWRAEVGVLRAADMPEPSIESNPVAHPAMDWDKNCATLSDNSLTYDSQSNRLFLVYVEGCKNKGQILVSSSDDEGRTWSRSVVVVDSNQSGTFMFATSAVVLPRGVLGVLWQEGSTRRSPRWIFACFRGGQEITTPTIVSPTSNAYEISNDSLRTGINQARDSRLPVASRPAININVFSELHTVWRGSGLLAKGKDVIAIFPEGNSRSAGLDKIIIRPFEARFSPSTSQPADDPSEVDVTQRTVLLFRSHSFDSESGILNECFVLANRGSDSVLLPISLRALEVGSPNPSIEISAVNSANRVTGSGASWNIGDAVVGDRIPAKTTSYPFCLSFHIKTPSTEVTTPQAVWLLKLKIKVLAHCEPVPKQ